MFTPPEDSPDVGFEAPLDGQRAGSADAVPAAPLNVKRGRLRRKAAVPLDTLLAWGRQRLVSPDSANMEPVWLLEWATGHDSLLLAPRDVGIRAAEKYRSAVAQRRAGVPLQHILGSMPFRKLTLESGPGVFTVRPETELLVDIALGLADEQRKGTGEAGLPPSTDHSEEVRSDLAGARADNAPSLTVADLCAGSGAIGLAVAAERPYTEVFGVELSEAAFPYLKRNAAATQLAAGSRVEMVLGDAIVAFPGREGTFDLVLTNPPYVGVADAPSQVEATHDPKIALYGGGEDGLVTPRGLVGRAFELLKPGAHLVMEHGETQAQALRKHARSVGFVDAVTRRDFVGRDRFLVARKPAGQTIDRAAEVVAAGHLIVLPTDTVYGIGADYQSTPAVARLLEVKGRAEDKPPPVLGPDCQSLMGLVSDSRPVREALGILADHFWPGPLTVVVPTDTPLAWDTERVGGTVALRVPNHVEARELLKLTGPLAVSSANLSGEPAAMNVSEARAYFGGKVGAYVDAGQALGASVSTIVQLSEGEAGQVQLVILRQGPIRETELLAALGHQRRGAS